MTETNDTTKSMIVKTYQASELSIDVSFTSEGFFNATHVAKQFGKQPRDWLTVKPTIDYIEAIKARTFLEENQLVRVVVGGSNPGTWLHPKLAVPFARWCNVDFAVWCDEQIYDILLNKNQSVAPAELTREQILVMALDSERERMRLAHELAAAQPMVQFHDEVRQAEGELKIDQACAILFNGSISAKKLREWLRNQGWMDKRKGMNKPTVWAIKHDYMRLRLSDPINKMVFEVPVITANGLTLLRHLYRTGELFLSTIPIEKRLAASTYQV